MQGFTVGQSLLEKLRVHQALFPYHNPVAEKEKAFTIYAGWEHMAYLTSDGRVLIDAGSWDGVPIREASSDEATLHIVWGSRSVPELLELLPPPPPESHPCAACAGSRWHLQRVVTTEGESVILRDVEGNPRNIVCQTCSGLGYLSAEPGIPSQG